MNKEEKKAADKKAAEEKKAADKKAAEEKKAEEKKAEEKKAEEEKAEEEKAEEKKAADKKAVAKHGKYKGKELNLVQGNGAKFKGLCIGVRGTPSGDQVFVKLNSTVSRWFNVNGIVE